MYVGRDCGFSNQTMQYGEMYFRNMIIGKSSIIDINLPFSIAFVTLPKAVYNTLVTKLGGRHSLTLAMSRNSRLPLRMRRRTLERW